MIIFLFCLIAAILLLGNSTVASLFEWSLVVASVGFFGFLTYAVLL